MQLLGIMGALPEEVARIADKMQDATSETYAGVVYTRGTLQGQPAVVCCGGMGKANAASTVQVLITYFGVNAVIFSGIAGNMSTQIGIGDVVISNELCYHDAEDRMLAQSEPCTALYTADTNLIDVAAQACSSVGTRYIVGRIATGDQFIGDPATKQRIVQAVNPACVEMEGAAVAQICMRNKIPFVVIRAMSDNSDESAEALGAEQFDIDDYVATSCAITIKMAQLLAAQ